MRSGCRVMSLVVDCWYARDMDQNSSSQCTSMQCLFEVANTGSKAGFERRVEGTCIHMHVCLHTISSKRLVAESVKVVLMSLSLVIAILYGCNELVMRIQYVLGVCVFACEHAYYSIRTCYRDGDRWGHKCVRLRHVRTGTTCPCKTTSKTGGMSEYDANQHTTSTLM